MGMAPFSEFARSRCVVVVAHPDDECLFSAGLLICQPADWTIICCSIPRRDPIRAYKFFDACAVLGAKPRLLPFSEKDVDTPLESLQYLDLSDFDIIVTHNRIGEYGHPHHKQVHRHITQEYGQSRLIYTFGYGLPIAEHDISIRLDDARLMKKMRALRSYDHELPYEGEDRPKWEALLRRYCPEGQENLRDEAYALHEA